MIQENLKAQRLKKGLSQEELAAQIHVVRQTVSKWEKGVSVPDAQTLIQIAQVLETPVSALLGEKIPEEKEEEKLQIMAEKLERINACLAERTRPHPPRDPSSRNRGNPFGGRWDCPASFDDRTAAQAAVRTKRYWRYG